MQLLIIFLIVWYSIKRFRKRGSYRSFYISKLNIKNVTGYIFDTYYTTRENGFACELICPFTSLGCLKKVSYNFFADSKIGKLLLFIVTVVHQLILSTLLFTVKLWPWTWRGYPLSYRSLFICINLMYYCYFVNILMHYDLTVWEIRNTAPLMKRQASFQINEST